MEGCKRLPALFAQMRDKAGGNHDSNADVTVEVIASPGQPTQQGESPTNAPAIQAANASGDGTGKKECPEELQAPIADLEKRLRSKTMDLTGQNRTRHQAVLSFSTIRDHDRMAKPDRVWL